MFATQEQNQTLPPQKVLTPIVAHLSSAPSPFVAPNAHRQLHYPEESRKTDLQKSILD